jgi:hypothetical protein
MGVTLQLLALATLPLGKEPPAPTADWMGPRASLGAVEQRVIVSLSGTEPDSVVIQAIMNVTRNQETGRKFAYLHLNHLKISLLITLDYFLIEEYIFFNNFSSYY